MQLADVQEMQNDNWYLENKPFTLIKKKGIERNM